MSCLCFNVCPLQPAPASETVDHTVDQDCTASPHTAFQPPSPSPSPPPSPSLSSPASSADEGGSEEEEEEEEEEEVLSGPAGPGEL